jgi:hypothetical protein
MDALYRQYLYFVFCYLALGKAVSTGIKSTEWINVYNSGVFFNPFPENQSGSSLKKSPS